MSNNTATTQFSIYKINYESVTETFAIKNAKDNEEFSKNIVKALINSTAKILKEKPNSQIYHIDYNDFQGLFFKTMHIPIWEGVAKQIITNNEYKKDQPKPKTDFLTNTNVSYILLYPYKEFVYAVTGGYGSNYISKFVEKNYGLYLLPKVINRDNPVIKSIVQNNLLGNQTATQKTNKNSTSIFLEQNMSSIFRQLNIEASREIALKFGIEYDSNESTKKKINIVNKDSIVIHRSVSITSLKKMIPKLYSLEKAKDLFALNYLVLATKKGLKNAFLFNKLVEVLSQNDFDRFVLTGDDYTSFYTCADKYILKNDENEIIIEQETPIEFKDVMQQIPNGKYTKTALTTILKKWTISTQNNEGKYVLYPLEIIDAIQGFVEVGEDNNPCYIFNGNWYVFDEKFSSLLSSEFKDLYKNQEKLVQALILEYNLKHTAKNENDYNAWLMNNPKIIVAHTALMDNVEIADAIFWDDKNIYLMHNKEVFSGIGARDVTNQVLTSAEYLQNNLASAERTNFIKSYYKKINEKYTNANNKIPIGENGFIKIMTSNRSINYIIGYIDGYKLVSRSTYAKYLTIEATKKLSTKGYGCITLNIK